MRPILGDRSLYPTLVDRAYLAHASMSPPSLPVQEALRGYIDAYAARGVDAFGEFFAQRTELKESLARLVGARAEEIALVPSTTRGLLDIALCLPWREGDRIVLFRGEFPTNVTPWQQVGAEIIFQEAEHFRSEQGLEELEKVLRDGVRLVSVSAVQFQTGLRMPLVEMGALCRRYGAEFCVDAIQACGIVPLDVEAAQVDYLASGCHKWLGGLEGSGFVYVRAGRKLRPKVAGWLSHENPVAFLFEGTGHLRYDRPIRESIDFLEVGSLPGPGLVALRASLGILLELGVESIYAHVQRYLDRLEPQLLEMGLRSRRLPGARASGSLALEAMELYPRLLQRGVHCSTPDGLLRISPHWCNPLEEVDLVVEAFRESLQGAG